MLSQNVRSVRYAGIGLCLAIVAAVLAFPGLKSDSVMASSESANVVMNTGDSMVIRKYDRLANVVSDCSPMGEVIRTFKANDPLAPLANLCVSGNSLAITDPNYQRVAAVTTGSGISGAPGCNLSAQTPRYDVFGFNLTGCAAFPTVVTVTLCGPAGCTNAANTDTVVFLYRNVAAGDPLTANGGLPGVFNPAAACTNVRAANDDLTGAAVATGGSSCNQSNTADCVATCAGATLNPGIKRNLGDGRFTIVIAGSGTSTTGNYNLYVDAPAAGCNVALAPTAANGGISGRVITPGGRGIGKTIVTVSGGTLGSPITALTNAFGYYSFSGLEAGHTYSVSVSSKSVQFANPTRIVTVQDDLTDIDFVSME